MTDIFRTSEDVIVKRAERLVNGHWEDVRYPVLNGPVIITGMTRVQIQMLREMLL